MKCCRQLITLSVSFFLLISSTAFGCDVVLKKSAEISNDKIYLKDIARLYPDKFSDIYIINTPYVGSSLVLTKNYLSSILKNKKIHLQICGSKTIVKRKEFLITRGLVKKISKLNNIKIISTMPIVLPFGYYDFKLKSIKQNGKFVWIVISAIKNGRVFRSIGVSAKMLNTVSLPVASCDIRRGDVIHANDIMLKKVNNVKNASSIINSINAIKGCVAVVDIKRGHFFTTSNTKRRVFVKRGDIVNVQVVENSVTIKTVAKALKSGFDKDTIPIMYLNTKRIVVAKVVGDKQVEVR
jgi:flagella basal body P-ring formation protein FlgA